MSELIFFKEGTYNIQGKPRSVAHMVFPVVEGFREDGNGAYVTVDARGAKGFPDRNIRIKVEGPESFIPHTGNVVQHMAAAKADETDIEIKERLRKRFQILTDMTQAAKEGNVKAVIVSGPPGVGKSFGVEQQLQKSDLFTTISGKPPKYEVVKGAMSALGLYIKLHEFKDEGNVIVFDDCDSILMEDLSLNILKAALDSSKKRYISWNTDSRALANENIPNKFEFKAAAIFISNIKFENVKSKRLKDHLDALETRCHYVDLTIDSERDKMLRIKQIVEDGMLREYDFEQETQDEILEFIDTNKRRFRELSLRTVLKLADLRKSFKDRWTDYAVATCMR
jgi:hypothetical protein